jgi:hypothetical protein
MHRLNERSLQLVIALNDVKPGGDDGNHTYTIL